MATIEVLTAIAAPIERAFDLARSIDLHVESAAGSAERAIAGVQHGLIGAGEQVTWSARHLGFRRTLTVRITSYERPTHFADTMLHGAFASMEHHHWFASDGAGTVMRDVLAYRVPLGIIGRAIDALFLERYMRDFLVARNQVVKATAESQAWRRYLE